MSVRVSTLVWGRSKARGHVLLLMVSLADQANDEGYCWPKQSTLARRLRLGSDRAVRKAISAAEELGELTTIHRTHEGRFIGNAYQINLDVLRSYPDIWEAPAEPQFRAAETTTGTTVPVPPEPQFRRPPEPQFRTITVSSNHQEKRNTPPTPQGVELPEWLSEEVWGDWLQHRREIKKPMTATASQKLLAKLGRLRDQGHDPASLIDEAISNGWQSVYEPKGVGKVPGAARRPANQADANQRLIERVNDTSAIRGVFDD